MAISLTTGAQAAASLPPCVLWGSQAPCFTSLVSSLTPPLARAVSALCHPLYPELIDAHPELQVSATTSDFSPFDAELCYVVQATLCLILRSAGIPRSTWM